MANGDIYTMHTDGGSRGNPGPSAIGFSITLNGEAVCEGGWPTGEGTNNEAEYRAIIWGLNNALAYGVSKLHAIADSELLVKQVNGQYRVKNDRLKTLHAEVLDLVSRFEHFELEHALRHLNKRPDELVNEALDTGEPVGSWMVPFVGAAQGRLFGEDVLGAPREAGEPVDTAETFSAPAADPDDDTDKNATVSDYVPTRSFQPVEQTILVGVTGCIAAYKSCEIVRSLQKSGYRVKVVMTENATRFVGPTTFRALTREPVAVGLFDSAADPIHHISLAKEADLMLVAPATANVIVKLASGIADDLLTTTALAITSPLVVAPAMNTAMWENPRVQEAIGSLRRNGVVVVDPASGYLSCGDTGAGKLAEVEDIVDAAIRSLPATGPLSGKRILVTSGPTFEPIDPVRYIGNRSSGLTGTLIAQRAACLGAQVTLVTGPVSLRDPVGVDTVHVLTAEEMLGAARTAFEHCDAAVFCAAVADFRPESVCAEKIKKDSLGASSDAGGRSLSLDLVENPDVLATLASSKGDRFVVGFAAETDLVLANASDKLMRKNADLIVANDVSDPSLGFGTTHNRIWLVDRGGIRDTGLISKEEEAEIVVNEIASAISG